jgi:hypothetical protein
MGRIIIEVKMEDRVATFDNTKGSLMSRLMTNLMEERARIRKSHPVHANVIKIAANSIY